MRVSDHFLEIERGKYTRIKKENRTCKFCDLREVEDEFHFFFSCKNNLKRQTSRFHYGSKVPVVTITVFITILEQNR
jgi:hypothetical protein